MKRALGTVELAIRKPGILLYSPFAAAHIREGENYFETKFFEPKDVVAHLRKGTLVAFLTEAPGTFIFAFSKRSRRRMKLPATRSGLHFHWRFEMGPSASVMSMIFAPGRRHVRML